MSDRYYHFPNHFEDVQEKVVHLRERSDVLATAAEKLGEGGPYRDTALSTLAALYASFAGCLALLAAQLPYKQGDRVRLVKAPKCEGGWAGSKHFLVVGAIGTIKFVSIDYLMRDWSVYVEFDDESRIASNDSSGWGDEPPHKKGDWVKAHHKHVYGFSPSFVAHVVEAASAAQEQASSSLMSEVSS